MSDNSAIEWCDATWNPVRGCSRVSPGCKNCYAERTAARFSGPGKPYDGLVRLGEHGPRWTGQARLVPHVLDQPRRWQRPRRIFVNSMSDLFHEGLSDSDIAVVFASMAAAPQHTFQVLTKRAGRMRAWFERIDEHRGGLVWSHLLHQVRELAPQRPALERSLTAALDAQDGALVWPLPNVWLGVSVEDQQRADERIPHLLATPAAVRFLSCEPLLERVWLDRKWLGAGSDCPECGEGVFVDEDGCCATCGADAAFFGVDWVIVGGESGPGARPFNTAWAQSLVWQCRDAGVACFVKQLGADPYFDVGGISRSKVQLTDKKGGDIAEWPEGLRVRQFPVAK